MIKNKCLLFAMKLMNHTCILLSTYSHAAKQLCSWSQLASLLVRCGICAVSALQFKLLMHEACFCYLEVHSVLWLKAVCMYACKYVGNIVLGSSK